MILLLKFVRWVLTALAALLALYTVAADGVIGLVIGMSPIAFFVGLMWIVPLLFRRPKPPSKQHVDFDPAIAHDNIALDTARGTLWIRDASGAERYLQRNDLLSWKTAHDWKNGTSRQRIELDVRDVQRPRWQVLFQRHSDRWVKSSKVNAQERDEWFARLRAWTQQPPSAAAQAHAAGLDPDVANMHRRYYEATTDEDRQNFLVAYDIACDTEDLDQKTEWERMGGSYPGPTPELLKFGKRKTG